MQHSKMQNAKRGESGADRERVSEKPEGGARMAATLRALQNAVTSFGTLL